LRYFEPPPASSSESESLSESLSLSEYESEPEDPSLEDSSLEDSSLEVSSSSSESVAALKKRELCGGVGREGRVRRIPPPMSICCSTRSREKGCCRSGRVLLGAGR
jgi:hypothetical protein